MKNKKSQACMEFLMTYGWAIVGAVVIIVCLYLFLFFVKAPIRACSDLCGKSNMTYWNLNDSSVCLCVNQTIIPIGKLNKEGKLENITR